jgi:hypothetical protein
MMIHPTLHSLLAHQNVRELHAAARRSGRARSVPRRARRVVSLRSPLVRLHGPRLVRLRAPLTISPATAPPTDCR